MKTRIPDVENEMSRRYLKIMQKWIPFAMSRFQEWPGRPNCGHFFGGMYFYGMETAFPMTISALTAGSPEYDEKTTGCSKEKLIQTAIKALRYLCFTHDTGPEDCVRENKHLPEPFRNHPWLGPKWGERGRGFFPESQCGTPVAKIVLSAALLNARIDKETLGMIENICSDYMKRFLDMLPRSGVYADTQAEENAWTALGLTASYLYLSQRGILSDQDGKIEDKIKRWMFCAATIPADNKNAGLVEKEKTAAELCGRTFTLLPDFMAENHGIVHPNYNLCPVGFTGFCAGLYRLYGRKEPVHLYWHRRDIYEQLKYLIDRNGMFQAVQGMDWAYLFSGIVTSISAHCAAGVYLNDPEAGRHENAVLDLVEKILKTNQGRMIRQDVAEKCTDVQQPAIFGENAIQIFGNAYLAHRLKGAINKQGINGKDVLRNYKGVKVYPHGGFAFHRHDRGQTSFSWRNSVMALPLTLDGTLTIAPGSGSLLTQIKVKEYPESQRLESLHIQEAPQGLVAVMIQNRAQESIRQETFFASLPDGSIVCRELITALKNCTVERITQGYLEIMNETIADISGNCIGFRKLFYPEGEKTFYGGVESTPEKDIIFKIDNPAWLNVDDRFGVVLAGNARTVYHNKHYFKPYRAIADDLFLNLNDIPGKYSAGETIAELSFLLCPEQRHAETLKSVFTRVATDENGIVGFVTESYLAAGNFGEKSGCFSLGVSRGQAVPVFSSATTVIREDSVNYQVALNAKQGNYFPAIAFLETNGEKIRAAAASDGDVYLTNEGNAPAEIKLGRKDVQKRIMLNPGISHISQALIRS